MGSFVNVTEGEVKSPKFSISNVDQSIGEVDTTLSSISISTSLTPGVILSQSKFIFSGIMLIVLPTLH